MNSNEIDIELKEYKECRIQLSAALKQEPENTKIISNLGILSLKENNISEAAGYFKTVLEIEPDPIAKNYIEYLEKIRP